MTTQDLHDLKQLFEFAILTGDKPELTKSDCEMVVAAVDRVLKSEWVSVSERMPDHDDYYEVASSEPWPAVYVLQCRNAEYPEHTHFRADGAFRGHVTHWKPLPDPPKVSV